MGEEKLSFLYKLLCADGQLIEFPIKIDKSTCTFLPEGGIIPLRWTALEHQQCENCTLHKDATPFCPIAINLIPILGLCNNVLSYQAVKLEVVTAERIISAETSMQRALTSILGLVMATSDCPHTQFLKPMARFHLPLATNDETVYRTTSMFMLAQYFRHLEGLDFSLELDGLKQRYEKLQIVNKALCRRLRDAVTEDATVNAVILLDLLSQTVNWSIEDGLEEIRYLFNGYGLSRSGG